MSASNNQLTPRFHVANAAGERLEQPSPEELARFLAALDPADEDRATAWVATDAGDVLEYHADGRLVRETPEGEVTHLRPITPPQAAQLWDSLGRGDAPALEAQPWQPGNGYLRDPQRDQAVREARLARERADYDALGPERPDVPCRAPGCGRGAVAGGGFCRPHHFTQLRGKPSPFTH